MKTTAKPLCTDLEWDAAMRTGLHFAPQGTQEFDATVHEFAQIIRAQSFAQELLKELQFAHQLILCALEIMTLEQKMEWARLKEKSNVPGEGTTRFHERSAVIAKALASHDDQAHTLPS